MADDRELLETELQALMEASADFSKGLSTVASRMRAIKSYLNSNVQIKTTSPSSRAKIRTRDMATSPIIFRTTRCTSVSPDRFGGSSCGNLLDISSIKMEKDEEIYDDHSIVHHAVDNRRLEMEQRIQQQRRDQEKAICSVGDICSVTRAGGLNVLTSAGGVTATRILSTTGGQISNKSSLLKAASISASSTSTGRNGKPSGLIYILKPVGNGKTVPTPVKFNSFNTVKKIRRILPNHNVINRVGSMSIMMDRSRQKILPKPSKNRASFVTSDTSNNTESNRNLEEDIVYAIQTSSGTSESGNQLTGESDGTSPGNDDSSQNKTANSSAESDSFQTENVTPTPEVQPSSPQNNNSDLTLESNPGEVQETEDIHNLENSGDFESMEEIESRIYQSLQDDEHDPERDVSKRTRGRRKSNLKSEEEKREYNRLRQAKYRAIKRQSDPIVEEIPVKKHSRRGRKSLAIPPEEPSAPKRPLILRQKRDRPNVEKNS